MPLIRIYFFCRRSCAVGCARLHDTASAIYGGRSSFAAPAEHPLSPANRARRVGIGPGKCLGTCRMAYPCDETHSRRQPGDAGFLRGRIGLSNRAVAINASSSTRSASLSAPIRRGPDPACLVGEPRETLTPATDDDDDVDAYDIPTVCRKSRVGRTLVYEAINRGELIARRPGKQTRLTRFFAPIIGMASILAGDYPG